MRLLYISPMAVRSFVVDKVPQREKKTKELTAKRKPRGRRAGEQQVSRTTSPNGDNESKRASLASSLVVLSDKVNTLTERWYIGE